MYIQRKLFELQYNKSSDKKLNGWYRFGNHTKIQFV